MTDGWPHPKEGIKESMKALSGSGAATSLLEKLMHGPSGRRLVL